MTSHKNFLLMGKGFLVRSKTSAPHHRITIVKQKKIQIQAFKIIERTQISQINLPLSLLSSFSSSSGCKREKGKTILIFIENFLQKHKILLTRLGNVFCLPEGITWNVQRFFKKFNKITKELSQLLFLVSEINEWIKWKLIFHSFVISLYSLYFLWVNIYFFTQYFKKYNL